MKAPHSTLFGAFLFGRYGAYRQASHGVLT